MEINYRAETKATNFGSKHVEPKTKLIIKNSIYLKGFYDPSKLKHMIPNGLIMPSKLHKIS